MGNLQQIAFELLLDLSSFREPPVGGAYILIERRACTNTIIIYPM
jgi:hypothetical protein